MEPRYIASRVARNSAISTRYLAAFAAICLVSTIVLSIGALMLSTFSDDQIARAICICLDVCFLHISLAITGVIVDMLQLVMVPMLQLLLKTRWWIKHVLPRLIARVSVYAVCFVFIDTFDC